MTALTSEHLYELYEGVDFWAFVPAHGDRWHEIWDEEYARDGHVEKVTLNPKPENRNPKP